MTHPAKPDASNANRYARYGLSLPQQTLRALEKRGIYCQPSVSIEHQHLARRYVLRGVESGGAVADMGRYCAYLDADGNPAPWLQQIDSISGNGRHAIVIAPELVRIEMLRIGHTYELAITRLWLKSEEGHTRPAIVTAPLFRGHQGTLAVELWNAENKALRGTVAPALLHRGRRSARPAGALRRGDSQDLRRGRMSGMQAHACRRGSGHEQRR